MTKIDQEKSNTNSMEDVNQRDISAAKEEEGSAVGTEDGLWKAQRSVVTDSGSDLVRIIGFSGKFERVKRENQTGNSN